MENCTYIRTGLWGIGITGITTLGSKICFALFSSLVWVLAASLMSDYLKIWTNTFWSYCLNLKSMYNY